jgi:dCMP deaminase
MGLSAGVLRGKEMGTVERPSLESLIMDFAMALTRRATCKRFQVGCVIASQDMTQIYGFGYNGTAKGRSHDECHVDQPGSCGCVHSEINALIKVRANDPKKVAFVTAQPCVTCAKAIVNSGVSKLYYRSAYRSDEGLEILKDAGVELERV